MGSATTLAELGLDLRPTMNGLLGGILAIEDGDYQVVKVEEYVRCLEEERRKIDAFKRELPLCMLILTDVIEALKVEVMQCRGKATSGRPVLEQFMPIKSKADEDGWAKKPEKDSKDKMNWMSSAQLWSDSNTDDNSHSNNNIGRGSNRDEDERSAEADRQSESGNPFEKRKYACGEGGAFLPFKGINGEAREEEKVMAAPLPDLSLLTPGFKGSRAVSRIPEDRSCGSSSKGKTSLVSPSSNAESNLLTQEQQQQQGPRKARRCWSPELHRRFVNALQQLGGSQVATPKQIRELMKVDGLTNDEVKSHLQKYRLHTRRLSPSSGSPNHQPVVVLGGLWVSSSDQYPGAKPSDSHSGSPQGPLQLARGISLTGVDSCEDEDGKSESYSWKGNSQRLGEEEAE